MQLYGDAQDSHKVLLNEFDHLAPTVRGEMIDKQRRIMAEVEGLIAAIRPETGPLALPLTMLFFGMINWTHTWYDPSGPVSPDAIADLAVDIMTGGLPNAV